MTNLERPAIDTAALEAEEAPDVALPEQERVYRAPARFGHVPVAREPLGWDPRNPGFRNHYPNVRLPTQVVERVSLGEPELEHNRLIWGDNLHIMRTLPSESVDLIYIDPPFFSNRVYNVIWGDEHEERSFSDIWEGGLDGYLIWLNARLYEMKRLLKPTGSIYVHCDWHASHYIKVEMDKIFEYENFRNEIVWCYTGPSNTQRWFPRKHDVILFYAKSEAAMFDRDAVRIPYKQLNTQHAADSLATGGIGGNLTAETVGAYEERGKVPEDYWSEDRDGMTPVGRVAKERVGYPTQKPEALVARIIKATSRDGDTVLDAFVGGGTTPVVAQRLGRKWIAIDQSRVGVAVTAERLKSSAVERELGAAPPPDFTVEHWGVYEAERLSTLSPSEFRSFVLECYDARIPSNDEGIHGYQGARARVPVWVGPPGLTSTVGATEVDAFAQAIGRLDRYQGDDGLRDGIMLAWGSGPTRGAPQRSYARAKASRLRSCGSSRSPSTRRRSVSTSPGSRPSVATTPAS